MRARKIFLSKKSFLILMFFLVVFILIIMTSETGRKLCCSDELSSYDSPDGNYRIVVYVYPDPFFYVAMPGSAGDQPGFVRLYNKENELLQEEDVPMVQLVDDDSIYWFDNKVNVKFVALWSLPKPEGN